jgi:hypothetical protein
MKMALDLTHSPMKGFLFEGKHTIVSKDCMKNHADFIKKLVGKRQGYFFII